MVADFVKGAAFVVVGGFIASLEINEPAKLLIFSYFLTSIYLVSSSIESISLPKVSYGSNVSNADIDKDINENKRKGKSS